VIFTGLAPQYSLPALLDRKPDPFDEAFESQREEYKISSEN
jgi:hypothetical protein